MSIAKHDENAGIQVDVAEVSPPQAVELEPVWVIEPVSACATVLLSLAWIFGASGLVARLAIAHWSLVRLRQSATAAGEEQLRLCRQLAQHGHAAAGSAAEPVYFWAMPGRRAASDDSFTRRIAYGAVGHGFHSRACPFAPARLSVEHCAASVDGGVVLSTADVVAIAPTRDDGRGSV